MITNQGILYIEPKTEPSKKPVIDELTMKMASALRQANAGILIYGSWRFIGVESWRKPYECSCGTRSTSYDYQLPGDEMTNSLAVHYLAWHRHEIPDEQLAKVAELPVEPVMPTFEELCAPGSDADDAGFPDPIGQHKAAR